MLDMLRRALRQALLAVVALVLVFEEWGWETLSRIVARLGRLPFFAWLESRIRRMSPWAALAMFAVPALSLVPVKLLALFLIGRGHGFFGVVVLLGAKVVGTALLARLFTLTQPALMQLAWFARWYPRWKEWKDRLIGQVRESAMWRTARDLKRTLRAQWDALRGKD